MTQPITRRADALIAEWADCDPVFPTGRAAQELEFVGDDYVLAGAKQIVSLVLDHPFAFEEAPDDYPDDTYPESPECADRAMKTCVAIDAVHEKFWFGSLSTPTRYRALEYQIACWQDDYETTRRAGS